jgi:hypothetical protein
MTEKYVEPTPADSIIRDAVEEYIHFATASGSLTKADIQIDPKTLVVTGWTRLETESGVNIVQSTSGYLALRAEFEAGTGSELVDITQEITLFPGVATEITEMVEGGQTETVPRRDHERIAIEMARLIKAIY